jgi:hypothetical protein
MYSNNATINSGSYISSEKGTAVHYNIFTKNIALTGFYLSVAAIDKNN